MDTCKTLHNNRSSTQVPGLQCCVLPRATLTVVLVTNHYPRNPSSLVCTRNLRHTVKLVCKRIVNLVCLPILVVNGTNQHVITDIVQVPPELQPWSRHADVVGRAFASCLDQNLCTFHVFAIPFLERSKELKAVAARVYVDSHLAPIRRRGLESILSWIESFGRKLISVRALEHHLLTIGAHQGVLLGVEAQITRDSKCSDQLWTCHKGVRGGVAIIASRKVPVVGGDDRIRFAFFNVRPLPLPNAGTACVGKHRSANLAEHVHDAIPADCRADLLRPRGDGERHLRFDACFEGLGCYRGRAGHVLVRAVGARTNQSRLQFRGPCVLLQSLCKFGKWPGPIRTERTIDMGLKF
mmetsp:Transcript_4227/g.26860  ORF Transcript_4227/g.26860 Transcript_4227/m.26860 type:complete len:353 (-) Transcript_4227:1099-2157(-)